MSRRATETGHRVFLWLLPIGVMCVLFYLSSLTIDELTQKGLALQLWDKFEHSIAYFVLSLLFAQALTGRFLTMPTWKQAFLAFILTIAYGFSDEIHQHFVPTRQMDVSDWLADCLGAAMVFFWAGVGSFRNGTPSRHLT